MTAAMLRELAATERQAGWMATKMGDTKAAIKCEEASIKFDTKAAKMEGRAKPKPDPDALYLEYLAAALNDAGGKITLGMFGKTFTAKRIRRIATRLEKTDGK